MHGAPPQPWKPFTFPSGRRLSARFARGVRGEGDFKVPSMHVEVDEDGYTVTACVPGVERDELHVALEGDILRLTGERRHEHVRSNGSREQARYFSRFTREVRLLREVDTEHIEAQFENGVLTVRLPVVQVQQSEERKPTPIPIH